MIQILRKLRAEHDDMTKVLDVLEREVGSYRQDGRLNRDIVKDALEYCRGYVELYHHPKVGLVCRKLRLAAKPAAINAASDLLAEHDAFSVLTNELEDAVDYLVSGTAKDRARFIRVAQAFGERHRHCMQAEDEKLFPLAEQCLSDKDWAEIDRGAAALEESHPAGPIDERFTALSQLIVAHEGLHQRLAGRRVW